MLILCSSRHYGQVTAGGDGSLRELVPSAKGLFYIRKLLKQQHLIKSQVTSILLALVTCMPLYGVGAGWHDCLCVCVCVSVFCLLTR